MRTNDGLFRVGQSLCGVSLAGILAVPWLRGADAAGPVTDNGPLQVGAGDVEHIELLTEIWQAAWGLDYVPDVSGLVATDLGNGEWFVLVSESGADETPFVDQGLFVQTGDGEHIALFNWDENLLAEAGLLSVEHTFMPGVLFGSAGWEGEIDAVLTEVVAPGDNPGDNPVTVQILTPVGLEVEPPNNDPPRRPGTNGTSGSDQVAFGQRADLKFTPGGPDDDLTPDCGAIWNLCRDACWAQFVGDAQACGFLAAGCVAVCVIGCAASTIAYGICIAICSAGCLAIEAGCLARAKARLNACNMTCDIARMTCEPGWVPPAAE
jgi:hypothetical protein